MLLTNPDLKTLNSSRRATRGKGLFLSSPPDEDGSSSAEIVSWHALPHTPLINAHIVLVLSAKKNEGPRLAIEFFRTKVRTIGAWPSDPPRLMLPALKASYAKQGLHFIFSDASLGLPSFYRFTHVIVTPTVVDFSDVGLVGSLFVSPVPTSFCSKRGVGDDGNPLYSVDYSQLSRES